MIIFGIAILLIGIITSLGLFQLWKIEEAEMERMADYDY